MSAATNYAENDILDTLLGTAANRWVKLHTGAPGEDATANASTETTRQAIQFAAASGGSKASNSSASFTSIGVSAQETITHISIWDASTAGNPLVVLALDTSRTVDPGDTLTVSATVTAD